MILLGSIVISPGMFGRLDQVKLHKIGCIFFILIAMSYDDSSLGLPEVPAVSLIFAGNNSYVVHNPIYSYYGKEVCILFLFLLLLQLCNHHNYQLECRRLHYLGIILCCLC